MSRNRIAHVLAAGVVTVVLAGCQTPGAPPPAAGPSAKELLAMPLADVERLNDEGNILATVELGVRYAEGRDVEKDIKRALALFERGVEAGDPSAMFAIGIAFAQGTGVPQDEVAAVYWYQRAADLGFMEAQYWLANMISSGRGGISGSWTGAAPLYFKAAQQGHTDAQYMIGQMYTYGNGVAIDYEKAAEWYRLSSKVKPNPKSEFNLLTLIAEGKVKWRPGDPGKNAAKNAKKAKEAENAVKAEN